MSVRTSASVGSVMTFGMTVFAQYAGIREAAN